MRKGDYIETYSGLKFYPMDPRPEEIKIEDMAHSLAIMPRFAGHISYPYSVAQHALNVYCVAKDRNLSERIQFFGLTHDNSECYAIDIPRPIKKHLPQYKEIEQKLEQAIWDFFGISPTEEEWKIVMQIDNEVLAAEGVKLKHNVDNWTQCYVRNGLLLPIDIKEYAWREIKNLYIHELAEILGLIKKQLSGIA